MRSGAGPLYSIYEVKFFQGFADAGTLLSIVFDQKHAFAHTPALASGLWLRDRNSESTYAVIAFSVRMFKFRFAMPSCFKVFYFVHYMIPRLSHSCRSACPIYY